MTAPGAPSSPVPAGWHPDPFGRYELRYHNGASWTADVAVAGQRYVDPMGSAAPMPPPDHAWGPTPAGGGRRNSGRAIAALVLGVCAVGIAWLPFLVVGGAVAGVLAIVFGVLGRRDAARGRSGRGLATAGLVLGPIALALSVVGVLFTIWMIDLIRPGDYRLTLDACETDASYATASGNLTNEEGEERSYVIYVDFLRPGTNSVLKSASVQIDDVPAGATVPWSAGAYVDLDNVDCRVADVTGGLPFGST